MTRQNRPADSNDVEALRRQVAKLQAEVADLRDQLHPNNPKPGRRYQRRSVRYESAANLFGLPIVSIARGPDAASGQKRGHAIGWIAFGDVATGAVAIGGIARGLIAVGGIAIGLFSVGGLAFGLVSGLGGLATGYFAVGGMVAGVQIVGGLRFPLG